MRREVRRYLARFSVGIVLYTATVLGTGHLLRTLDPSRPVEILLALLPMLPVAIIAWALLSFVRTLDELHRRIVLEAFALAGLVVGMASFAWGFLEGLPGVPDLPAIFVLPAMIGVFGLAQSLLWMRYR